MSKWILAGVLVVAVVSLGIYAAAQEKDAAAEKAMTDKAEMRAAEAAEKAVEKTEGSAEKPAAKPAAKAEKAEGSAVKAAVKPAVKPAAPETSGRSMWRTLMTMSAKKGTPVLILANGEALALSDEQAKKIGTIADKAAADAKALLTAKQKTKLAAIQKEMSKPTERR